MQAKTVVPIISLLVAALGGVVLLVLGALFGYMVGSGGLYGNGALSDATFAELAIGLCILILSCFPLVLVLLFTVFWWQGLRLPRWSTTIGWVSVVCILGTVFLNLLSASLGRHGVTQENLGILTLPVFPFALGLMGFLAFSFSSKDN